MIHHNQLESLLRDLLEDEFPVILLNKKLTIKSCDNLSKLKDLLQWIQFFRPLRQLLRVCSELHRFKRISCTFMADDNQQLLLNMIQYFLTEQLSRNAEMELCEDEN